MKKIIFTLFLSTSAILSYADCTQTANGSASASTTCEDGATITVTASTTATATGVDCNEAKLLARIIANNNAFVLAYATILQVSC